MKKRPDCIKHYSEIQNEDNHTYPQSDEKLGIGSPFGKHFGLKRLGIHHEVLPPGRRTSYPHAESTEEEFVFVIEGNPQVWLDGEVYDLVPGDAVGFPPGTGVSHTFINNSDQKARLLVVGDTNREDNRIYYPLNPERKPQVIKYWWHDVPQRPLGKHPGKPDPR